MNLTKSTFWGYKRENGRVGVRNHVIILPVDDLSNAAAQAVENNVKGTMALPHPYGRLQFGADLELHFRTLIGTGSNPNVAAVVVICIEEEWGKKVADGIRASGKPVAHFGIEQHGDHDTIMRASKAAKEYVQWASELRTEECPISDLWVSTKCGESDTTSGCGSNPTVGSAFDKDFNDFILRLTPVVVVSLVVYLIMARWLFRSELARVATALEPDDIDLILLAPEPAKVVDLMEALRASLSYDFRDRLPDIRQPTLIVWGENDSIIPVKDAQEFQRLIPDSRKVVMQETGHVPMAERAPTFNDLMMEFLAETGPASEKEPLEGESQVA